MAQFARAPMHFRNSPVNRSASNSPTLGIFFLASVRTLVVWHEDTAGWPAFFVAGWFLGGGGHVLHLLQGGMLSILDGSSCLSNFVPQRKRWVGRTSSHPVSLHCFLFVWTSGVLFYFRSAACAIDPELPTINQTKFRADLDLLTLTWGFSCSILL